MLESTFSSGNFKTKWHGIGPAISGSFHRLYFAVQIACYTVSIIVISHCLPECTLVSGHFPLSMVGNEAEGNDCLGSSWWREWTNSDCQTAVRTMGVPAAWFPLPAFIHLLKLLYLMRSWNGELISPKTQQKTLMTMICLSGESSWSGN